MIRVRDTLRAMLGSLAGRLTLILTCGVMGTSILSLLFAENAHVRDYQRARLQRVVDSTVDIARRLDRDPVGTKRLLGHSGIFGAHEGPVAWKMATRTPELDAMLTERLGSQARARSFIIPSSDCFPGLHFKSRAAGLPEEALPSCASINFVDRRGGEQHLSIDVAPSSMPRSSILDPRFFLPLLGTAGILSLGIARLLTAPLRRLTGAAHAFSVTIDPEPIQETGPREIRAALATFNVMQHRVREGFRERTQMLAAATHDLQTPLTRLRLRLEQVTDETIRAKLITDMAAMQHLVQSGLELARSSESREGWVVADIDSVLSSVAEDAAEMGHDVRFVGGCGTHARVKADALVRCLTNLVDNAVRYGGSAEVGCAQRDGAVWITVRDHGPGLDEIAIEQALEPFQRLVGHASNTVGSGLGLAISKAQARTFGAELKLCRSEEGGLLASIIVPHPSSVASRPRG